MGAGECIVQGGPATRVSDMLGISIRIDRVIQAKITCMKVLASRLFAVGMLSKNES